MSLNKPKQNLLLTLAWQSIAHGLKTGKPLAIDLSGYPEELSASKATVVSLAVNNRPQGSFGRLHPIRPLAEDVCENAFAAAFCDQHCQALTESQLDALEITIEIVSPLTALHGATELDLIGQLKPHIDGLLLHAGTHHTFLLPSNWETYPAPFKFMQHLKHKAGLPPTYWSQAIQIYRFSTEPITLTPTAHA